MKIYVCFHMENGIKKIYLMFVSRGRALRFMKRHADLLMEEWEAIT